MRNSGIIGSRKKLAYLLSVKMESGVTLPVAVCLGLKEVAEKKTGYGKLPEGATFVVREIAG